MAAMDLKAGMVIERSDCELCGGGKGGVIEVRKRKRKEKEEPKFQC